MNLELRSRSYQLNNMLTEYTEGRRLPQLFKGSASYLEIFVVQILRQLAYRDTLLRLVWPVVIVGFRLLMLPAVLLTLWLRITMS